MADAFRLRRVEVRLHLDVRLLVNEVEDRVPDRADRRERRLRVIGVAAVADRHRADLPTVPLGWDEGRGWRVEQQEPDGELARSLLGQRPVRAENLVRALVGPRDESADDGRPDLVQAERERGDGAEVRARAAHGPEEVGVLLAARTPDETVGGHDLDLDQVVDRPPEPPGEVAQAAA